MWTSKLGDYLKQIASERLLEITPRHRSERQAERANLQWPSRELPPDPPLMLGEAGDADAAAVRPPPDTYPAPDVTVTDTVGPHGECISAGGYMFTYEASNRRSLRLHVNAMNAPRQVGGSYELGSLPPGLWHVLLDRRGFRLPIAVRNARPRVIDYRIDPAPLENLPPVMALRGY